MSLAFWVTTLIVVVSPGTGVLYTLAAGLSRGSRASVIAAFGCTLGIVPHMAAAMHGPRGAAPHQRRRLPALKYLGVAYLLYMAWNALKETGALKVEKQTRRALVAPGVVVDAIADQPAQSQALDLLRRLPAAVRRRRRGASAAAHGRAVRRLHGGDLRRLRRSTASSPRRRAATCSSARACSPGCAAPSPPPSARWRCGWRWRSGERGGTLATHCEIGGAVTGAGGAIREFCCRRNPRNP